MKPEEKRLASWLQTTVEGMVTEPDKARVTGLSTDGWLALEIRVGLADRGRVIGRNGVAVRSMRVLLDSMASLNGIRFNLSVHDATREP